MNAVFAFGNDVHDLFKSKLTSVACFESAPRPKADIMDSKNYRIEEWGVRVVKWTVDENVPREV